MEEEQKNKVIEEGTKDTPVEAGTNSMNTKVEATPTAPTDGPVAGKGGRYDNKKQKRYQGRSRNDGPKSEMDKRVLAVRRVVRVAAGGRRFSFSAAVVIGNRKGKVGMGMGKGSDVAVAIDKAVSQANKRIVTIPLTKDFGLPYEVSAKYCASKVSLRPAQGIVAGGALRSVAELTGIKNVNAKILSRSKCHYNNAHATIMALKKVDAKRVK